MKVPNSTIIKTTLNKADMQKFFKIKEKLGVQNNSEVLRICIADCFREMQNEQKEASSS